MTTTARHDYQRLAGSYKSQTLTDMLQDQHGQRIYARIDSLEEAHLGVVVAASVAGAGSFQ